jgi:hypothetical protein
MTQLERTRSSVVMNIIEFHYSAIPWDKQSEGSRGVSDGPAQGGDVGTTMETQYPVEDPSPDGVEGPELRTDRPNRVAIDLRMPANSSLASYP